MVYVKPKILLLFLMALFFITGCGHISTISVVYQSPEQEQALTGRSFTIEVSDNLGEQPLLGKSAAEMLPHFRNTFVLTINRQGKRYSNEGGLDLDQLVYKALAERLRSLGAVVEELATSGTELLRVEVDSFNIDKVDRKWIATINYKAFLVKEGKNLRQESVRAQVERVTLLGPQSVNTVATDLVEAAINKLELKRLLGAD